ncbi:MAG: hypothetical protein ACOCVY_01155 [Patescibacteria group bacterium]
MEEGFCPLKIKGGIKMILNLLGAGGSGKTTLKFLLNKEEEFYTFVPLTTRERRKNEIDGVHYHFVTLEQFKKDDSILLTRNAGNGCLYGNRKEDIVNHKSITVTTLDINGIKELERLGIPLKVVFLNISEKERRKRMLFRGDAPDKVVQRLSSDRYIFSKIDIQSPVLIIERGENLEIVETIKKFSQE